MTVPPASYSAVRKAIPVMAVSTFGTKDKGQDTNAVFVHEKEVQIPSDEDLECRAWYLPGRLKSAIHLP